MTSHYKGIQRQTDNPYLNMYKMDAIDRNGREFGYYFATRRSEDELVCKKGSSKPDGVVVYAVVEGDEQHKDRIVLIRQYRYPINQYIYELPAGLVEKSETTEEAAARELKEETGLNLNIYNGGNKAFRKAFYQAQGLCDESNALVFGYASAEDENTIAIPEASEYLEVILADKRMALEILEKEELSIRCAYMLMNFINSPEKDAFAFLDAKI